MHECVLGAIFSHKNRSAWQVFESFQAEKKCRLVIINVLGLHQIETLRKDEPHKDELNFFSQDKTKEFILLRTKPT